MDIRIESLSSQSSQANYLKQGKKVAWVGAVVNLSLALFKLMIGYFGRSQALIADGVHSFSDLICDFLVLMAAKYGNAEADEDHPYGHYRIETLITLALGCMLLLVGMGIAVDAAFDMAHAEFQKPSVWTVVVAVVSILANESLFFYTSKIANLLDSNALRANAAHARSDSLASVVVLVGLVGALLGWEFLDAVAAIVVSLIIIKMGLHSAWHSLSELADKGLDEENLSAMREEILKTEGVLAMHQLRTRQMGSRAYLDVHILIPPYSSASEGHQIAERVHVGLTRKFPNLFDMTIHVDVENHPEVLPENLLMTREELKQKLDPYFDFKIQEMDLYYLKNQIEIRLILPLEGLSKFSQDFLESKIKQALTELKVVKNIQVVFA